jgi:hypothetical protein
MNVQQQLVVTQIPSGVLSERLLNERLGYELALGWRAIAMQDHNGMLVLLMERPALSEEAAPTEPTYEVFTASDGLPAIRMVEEAAPCAKVPCERAATAEAERDALKGQVNRLNHLLSLRSNVEERMAAEGIPVGTDDLLLLAMGATPLGEATTACPTCADAGFVMGPIGERLPCPNDAFHRPSEETTP